MISLIRLFTLAIIWGSTFSCHYDDSHSKDDFLNHLSWRWEDVQKVSEVHPLVGPEAEVIKRPAGVWMPLLRTHYLPYADKMDDCFFYRVKSELVPGSLKVIPYDGESCADVVMGDSEIKLEDIESLKVELRDERFLTLFLNHLEHGQLQASVELKNKESALEYRQYASPFRRSTLNGSFWFEGEVLNEKKNKEVLGGEKDSFSSRELVPCFQLNDRCEEVMAFRCHECRHGWFPVVGTVSCPQGHNKYCGVSRCGSRGEPACLRGRVFANRALQREGTTCFEGSEAGFCQQGLETTCLNDVLICQ